MHACQQETSRAAIGIESPVRCTQLSPADDARGIQSADVYRRYAEHAEWSAFFAQMTAARDSYLDATEHGSLDDLVRDYTLVRAGDLASLTFSVMPGGRRSITFAGRACGLPGISTGDQRSGRC